MFYYAESMLGLILVVLGVLAGLIVWLLLGRSKARSKNSIHLENVLDLLLAHASYLCSLADRVKAGEVLSQREQKILDSSTRTLVSVGQSGFTIQEFSDALVALGKAVSDGS